MYKMQLGARAADGLLSHGSLDAYIGDFHACSKAFEMFVADRLSAAAESQPSESRAFLLWEDIDAGTKEARGLTKADAGVDVTDGTTTLVQCKLRARHVTWRECATFFASAVSFADGAYIVPWRSLLLARNACSTLSRTLAELGASRPFDTPIQLSEFRAYAEECLAGHFASLAESGADASQESAHYAVQAEPRHQCHEIRDYQVEAIELCVKETAAPAYVVLPTGCGKSLVMALVAARSECRVIVFVPLVVLLEQLIEVLLANGCEALAVGGGHECTAHEISAARVVVCVYNSAHKVDAASYRIVMIDEAHCVRRPAIYGDLDEGDEDAESVDDDVDPGSPTRGAGYAAVRAASRLPTARLISATQDVPDGAERCERTLRWSIDAGYLCDYTLDVPVFDVGAGNADLARYLVRSYRSIIVFCATRAEGIAFCSAMNELGPCARFLDCETGRRERCETLAAFRSGELAFVVNVRVLAMGFDAPITKGVCFVSMPASKTHIIQVVGGCLRKHPDKRMASVVLPFVTGHDDGSRACDFFRILAQNDTRLKRALARDGLGYVDVWTPSGGAGPLLLRDEIADSVHRAARCKLDAMIDALRAHYEEHGALPKGRNTPLGRWTAFQRANRDTMSAERRDALQALTFWTWRASETAEEKWHRMCTRLAAHVETHGAMPTTANDKRLYVWAYTQSLRRAQLSDGQISKLEAIRSDFFEPRSLADCTVLSPRPISTIGELFQTSSTGSGAFLSRWLSHPTARGR